MKSCGDAVFRVGIAGISEAGRFNPRVGRGFPAFAGYPDMTQSAVLDRDHLAHITLGDEALEREVLGLFHRQAQCSLDAWRTRPPG